MNNFSFARRENNPKREFIIVNKFQSKHFPSVPSETVREFSNLGRLADESTAAADGADCAVIGFAETAVAVGAYIARAIGGSCFYVSTTREELPRCFETLSFEESHSHAVLHTLCMRRPDIFGRVKRVIIADDEFTTGQTAVKLANALRGYLSPDCRITAAAFIASDESRRLFAENGIECIAQRDMGVVSAVFPENFSEDMNITPCLPNEDISLNAVLDFRLGVSAGEYFRECERLCGQIPDRLGAVSGTVRVIGTEELCVPPIVLGEMLERRGFKVRVQGVTRSPMLPSDEGDYPIRSRAKLKSLYDPERTVYLYNSEPCDVSVIITDAENPAEDEVKALCGAAQGRRTVLVRWRGKAMRTSIRPEDGRLLLKDITGMIKPMTAKEREPLIQSGTHYSELLPAEYEPSPEYIKQYERGLSEWAGKTAEAVAAVAERIYAEKGGDAVIVSLARAGTPIGMLIVRYLRRRYGVSLAHYSVSIIRGRGLDRNAMRYILARHKPDKLQFVDGWTGKGAITGQLREALTDCHGIDNRLAVLADPAGLCEICGTHDDIFIPCSCLNSVVSGLFSRTVLRGDIISEDDFHGAAYFGELAAKDRTYEFTEAVESRMDYESSPACAAPLSEYGGGLRETEEIARAFGVTDINLVKPSIGETTRVLLRRIPRLVLVRKSGDPLTAHIEELAREKGVEVREYPLRHYRACGIIQFMGDV